MISPIISICIPTYNGAAYLQEAFASIQSQTFRDFEVVISDDNSNDRTLEICSQFQSDASFPVHIIKHNPSGIGANWNHCIQHSKGKYIKFLFQDDVLEPLCLAMQLEALQKNKLYAVCSKRTIINEQSEVITSGAWLLNFGDLHKDLHLPDAALFVFNKKSLKRIAIPNHNYFGEPDTFLFDRQLFDEIGYFNTDYKQILDLEFTYRILEKYDIGIQQQALLKFRVHALQASAQNQKGAILKEYEAVYYFVINQFHKYLSWDLKKLYYLRKWPILNTFIQLKNRIIQ